MRDHVATLTTIRQFQSDVDDIRNTPVPRSATITLATMTAFLLLVALLLCFARVDRVVASRSGKIVPVRPNLNFQALDQSIITTVIPEAMPQR